LKDFRQFILLVFIFSCTFSVDAQQIIKGRILAEDLEPLPGVDIFAGANSLTRTDIEGYFQTTISDSLDSLTFAFIGFESTTVPINESCNNFEVILMNYVLYHNISNKKVDKLRKRRFGKLSELHEIAAQKGMFHEAKPCYPREFHPHKPELDEIKKEMKAKRKTNKKYFKILKVGDTIQIPFSGSYRYDGTDRTTLHNFSYVVDGNDFECVIEGILFDKNKGFNKHELTFKVTNLEKCSYENIVYNDQEIQIGDILEYNMKYFKIIKE
jgi:hypothetical protein